MQRRDFLKGACRICLLGSAGAAMLDLESCSPATGSSILKPEVVNHRVAVPLTSFDAKPLQIISPKRYPFEIAVEKKADGSYKALLLKCTHFENELVPNKTGYLCTAHGSKFDTDGKVLKGPAGAPLIQLKTTITNTDILIHV